MKLPDTSSLSPKIRHVPGLKLTPAETSLLARAFADSDEIFVERDFRSGYSGAVVLLVSPGAGQAQVVVKLGLPNDLQREYRAYHQYVMPASPQNTARLKGEPLLAEDEQLALLSYTFAGGDPRQKANSLQSYYFKQGGQAAADVLDRVFRTYGRQWWAINRPQKFVVSEQYDRLLHVHLMVKPAAAAGSVVKTFSAGAVSAAELLDLQPEQIICLQGFSVAETRLDKGELTLTADPPSGEASAPLRIRLEQIDSSDYHAGQQLEVLEVVVTATRKTLLADAARAALPTFDPAAPNLNLHGRTFPNPLQNLSQLLDPAIETKVSTIHGDLNLENILVDEETGFAWLIDFAETRVGPTLFDLQRLEGQIITKLLPSTVEKVGLGPEVMIGIYDALHGDPPQLTAPHTALQGVYTLLANVRRLARQYLMDDRDWDEYYLGLVLSLLGTLKFRRLEPLAPSLALMGAMAAHSLMHKPVPVRPNRARDRELTGYRVLVVEDTEIWQDILRESLTEIGCLVEVAATFSEARSKLQQNRFNLITIDAHLAREVEAQEGILLLNYIRNRFGTAIPAIIISGEIAKRDVIKAFKQFSVTNVLLKEDFDYDEFRAAVRDALLTSQM